MVFYLFIRAAYVVAFVDLKEVKFTHIRSKAHQLYSLGYMEVFEYILFQVA